jgi:hypothetical protein
LLHDQPTDVVCLGSSGKSTADLLHFRIGVIGVSLNSRIERFRQDYLKLYKRYQISEPDEGALALAIRRHWKRWWKGAQYEIRGNEEGVSLRLRAGTASG